MPLSIGKYQREVFTEWINGSPERMLEQVVFKCSGENLESRIFLMPQMCLKY